MRLHEAAHLLVAGVGGHEAMTGEDPSRVRVGHEDRTARGVEQDRVHRLGAEPVDRQHLAAQGQQRSAAHAGEAPAEALEQPAGEGGQPPGLDPRRPALRAEPPLERRVEPQQPRLRGVDRRPRNLSPAENA